MSNKFVVSDTHFSHSLLCTATAADGSKVPPWIDVAAMDEALIDAWNAIVRPGDEINDLGDVAIARKAPAQVLQSLDGFALNVLGHTHHAAVPLPDGRREARCFNARVEHLPSCESIEVSEVRVMASPSDRGDGPR